MNALLVDINEPEDIISLMKQSATIVSNPLNNSHLSDYYFAGSDFRTRQYSRKQAGEVLSDINEAEAQIADYYPNADENYQIIEGIISSIPIGHKPVKVFNAADGISVKSTPLTNVLYSYKVAPNGHIYDEAIHKVSPALFNSWIFQLSQCGVVTFYTINYIETAKLLVHHFKSANSEEAHTTLQRYIRPKIQIREHDPFIMALMALSAVYKLDIGEAKATAIRDAGYNNLFDIAMSSTEELQGIPGIGKTIADRLLTAIGKEL